MKLLFAAEDHYSPDLTGSSTTQHLHLRLSESGKWVGVRSLRPRTFAARENKGGHNLEGLERKRELKGEVNSTKIYCMKLSKT